VVEKQVGEIHASMIEGYEVELRNKYGAKLTIRPKDLRDLEYAVAWLLREHDAYEGSACRR
jgi:hypothetical protein